MVERGHDCQVTMPSWNPSFVLDRAPLPARAFVRDFQQGKAENVADTIEQALLLPGDIVDLRSMRKREVCGEQALLLPW